MIFNLCNANLILNFMLRKRYIEKLKFQKSVILFDLYLSVQFINTSGRNSWAKSESVYKRIVQILKRKN